MAEEKNSTLQNVSADSLITAIGAKLAKNAYDSGDLTGRKTLFHGTSEDIADKIRKEGLKPVTDENAGITKVTKAVPGVYEDSLGKSFTTTDKQTSRMYAAQRDIMGDFMKTYDKNDLNKQFEFAEKKMETALEAFKRFFKQDNRGVVNLNVPTWKHKIVDNPEAGSSFKDFLEKRSEHFIDGKPTNLQKIQLFPVYNGLKNKSVVFDGPVDTKYIKGSSDYVKNSLGEIGEYIAKHPGNFGKGLGKLALGGGLATYGVKKLHDHTDESEKNDSSIVDDIKNVFESIDYSMIINSLASGLGAMELRKTIKNNRK